MQKQAIYFCFFLTEAQNGAAAARARCPGMTCVKTRFFVALLKKVHTRTKDDTNYTKDKLMT